jgi:hypothetical protein
MTTEHADRPHDDGPDQPARTGGRRTGRRTGAVAGTIGLAAVLAGGGVYLLTKPKHEQTVTTTAQATSAASSPTPAPSSAPASPSAGPTGQSRAAKASSARPRTPQEEVSAARRDMAKNGVEVIRPLAPPDPAGQALAASATQTDTGSLKNDGGTMRVVTAHGDLTGLRELAWVAGGVTVHGDVRCTQTFRFANQAKPTRQPTLLLCWKTSPTRSVVTAQVRTDGHPSVSRSTAVIAREWRKLG